MKLSTISIVDENKNEKTNMPLNLEMYFVTEIYMHFFKKIELDGSSKLSIHFNKEAEKSYKKDSYFHVSKYVVDGKMVQKLYEKRQNEKAQLFLDIRQTIICFENA